MKLDPHKLALEKIAAGQEGSDSPLEGELEINREIHPLLGCEVQLNDYADEELRQSAAKVTGVIFRKAWNPPQIAGLEVEVEGKVIQVPKSSVWIDRKYVEDVHLDSRKAQIIQEALAHWSVQRNYYGPSWNGVEAFNFELAKVADVAHVEAAGWYKYGTSLRPDMDGKNWRLCIPDDDRWVTVNCHSILHDSVWTLSTTTYSTREVFGAKPAGSDDHWHRTLMWTLAVAQSLATDGYTYDEVIKRYIWRLSQIPELRRMAREILPGVIEAYRDTTGDGAPRLPGFSIGMSHVRLQPNTVGRHEPPDEYHTLKSIITIAPEAASDPEYLRHIVTHELIHYVLGTVCDSETHDDLFNDIAVKVKLPTEYRD